MTLKTKKQDKFEQELRDQVSFGDERTRWIGTKKQGEFWQEIKANLEMKEQDELGWKSKVNLDKRSSWLWARVSFFLGTELQMGFGMKLMMILVSRRKLYLVNCKK